LHDSLWGCVALAVSLNASLWAVVPKWRQATSLMFILSVGWFAGMFVLIQVCDFRLNPHRAEAWAGVAGMLFALIGYLLYQKNIASLMLVSYGIVAGGLGFSCGNFIQMLGRGNDHLMKQGEWNFISWMNEKYNALLQSILNREADQVIEADFFQFFTWTMMEQFFGYCMGFGVALGVVKLVSKKLVAPKEDVSTMPSNLFSVFFLFGPLMYINFQKHIKDWPKHNKIASDLLGFDLAFWYPAIGLAYMGIILYALYLIKQGRLNIMPATRLGKAQLLALLVILCVLMMYLLLPHVGHANLFLFLLAIAIGLIIILRTPETPIVVPEGKGTSPESTTWIPGFGHWLLYLVSPLVLYGLASATMQFGMDQKQYRFPQPEQKQEAEQSRIDSLNEPIFLSSNRSELIH